MRVKVWVGVTVREGEGVGVGVGSGVGSGVGEGLSWCSHPVCIRTLVVDLGIG